ncbi:MAG: glycosyltransferase family 2 protein [Rhodopirellula sp. JB044]|uniref:glycosyltransferase family 2 protein n=1 Tax=Rhodopirellula sp. JB044 TaxID=3342844 RepID=UPI00370A8E79
MQSAIPAPLQTKSGWPWEGTTNQPNGTLDSNTRSPANFEKFPPITVITPSYNQGDFLEETIRSVLMQGYPNLEYIVVDGGSTDKSGSILNYYASHITHVICEKDEGQSDAICKGLRLATGEIFNWINSDDRLEPGALHEIAAKFRPSADLYAFDVCVEDANGKPPTDSAVRMVNRNLSAKAMLRCDRYSFSQPGLWFRMSALNSCGGIDRNLHYGFDWDLIVRYLAEHPKVIYSSSLGAMFRLHDQSKTVVETSKDVESENKFKLENLRIREKLERQLSRNLAQASRLGRKREPWNQHMIEVLDDFETPPMKSAWHLMVQAAKDPGARISLRTLGSIARLLSRYVRRMPKPNTPG